MTEAFELGIHRLKNLIYNIEQGWEIDKSILTNALKEITELLEA